MRNRRSQRYTAIEGGKHQRSHHAPFTKLERDELVIVYTFLEKGPHEHLGTGSFPELIERLTA